MHEVPVAPTPLDRLAPLLGPERAAGLEAGAGVARQLLSGRTVWNVNATASGGGVAEMLATLLGYTRGADIDSRWLVLEGTPTFFEITKRLHNMLHGSPGDGGPLGAQEERAYEQVLGKNLDELRRRVRPGDIVLLHDPQTAGLVEGLRETGAHVVWRCHIGRDTPNEHTDRGWAFLRRYVEDVEASIYSRAVYAPDWAARRSTWVIPPSLDPFSAKNALLGRAEVEGALRRSGLVDGAPDGSVTYRRRDGSTGQVRRHEGLFPAGGPLPPDARVVMQVSRWDRLKDMAGVLSAFADHMLELPGDSHLVLVGPEVTGVSDDPEGAEVLDECGALWRSLAERVRKRTHLVALPMDDADENAFLVNALQHHASVVVQKSLVEGFGLTVTEPMWKSRPVVASRVGGIQDQIVDGVSGLLVSDPANPEEFSSLVGRVLSDSTLADHLGREAHARVRSQYLGDRHLLQYVDLFTELLQR